MLLDILSLNVSGDIAFPGFICVKTGSHREIWDKCHVSLGNEIVCQAPAFGRLARR